MKKTLLSFIFISSIIFGYSQPRIALISGLRQWNTSDVTISKNNDLPKSLYTIGLEYQMLIGHSYWLLNYNHYPNTKLISNDSLDLTSSGYEFNLDFHPLNPILKLGNDFVKSDNFSLVPLIGITAGNLKIKTSNNNYSDFFFLATASLNSRNHFKSKEEKKGLIYWGFSFKYSFDVTNSVWKEKDSNQEFDGNKFNGLSGNLVLGINL